MRLNAKMTGDQPTPLQFKQGVLKDPEWDLADRLAAAIKERMSPAGALGLPALLDERRLRYGIPDEAFQEEALFDRIYVWQIEPRHEQGKKTFGDTSIIKPESQQKRALKESSRAVLLSAGLKALSELNSNGVRIGHIVNLIRMSPWHKLIGNYMGLDIHLLVLRSGDLVGSEDIVDLKKAGKVIVEVVNGGHQLTDEDGQVWAPKDTFVDDSY